MNLVFHVEHMKALMIDSIQGIKEYKKTLFTQYANKKPKVLVIIGNGGWTFLHNDIKEQCGDVPIILCSNSEYTSSFDNSMIKNDSNFKGNQIPLKETTQGFNITILKCPVYIKETIDLIYQLKPKIKKLIFISDGKYVSAQNRLSVKEITEKHHPDLKVQYLTEGSLNTDMLLDSIQANTENIGILYYSWVQKVIYTGNNYLSANAYKTIGSFSTTPIFTLEDIGVDDGFLAGGYFYKSSDLKLKVSEVVTQILNGKEARKIPDQSCGKPYAILNYNTLQLGGISNSLYPDNAIYYHKPPGFLEKNKYLILCGIIACFIYFLILKVTFFKKKQKTQIEELRFLSKYKNLINNMPIAYFQEKIIADEHGEWFDTEIVDINSTFKREFTEEENIIGKRNNHDKKDKTYLEIYKSIVYKHETKTIKYHHKSTDKYYEIMLFPTTEKDVVDVFCIDNTALHKAQQLLETTNHKLSLALEIANITPWKWDLQEKTIQYDVNNHRKEDGSSSKNEILIIPEKEYFIKIHSEDLEKVNHAYLELVSGKVNKLKEEYRVATTKSSKEYEWVEIQAAVDNRDENGNPLTLIGSSLIITERKKMETDMRTAKNRAEESNKLKSAFLANMSHEIRTPLNAIIEFSNILAITDDENEKKEYITIIDNNNTLLLQLIGDILDLSKIEAGTMEFVYTDVDLNALLNGIEQTSQLKITTDVKLGFTEKLPHCYIHTDKHRLMQIITNMINNAIKFTQQGYINFGYHPEGNNLYFFVEDSGCGIPKDQLESVFGRFVKLNNFIQGTGLGLSICETIIHKMEGEIGVKSKEGKGSTFWFTLPYASVEPQEIYQEKKIPFQEKTEKNKLRILIAEDNTSNYKLFETILKSDYKLIHAWNGQEAIDLYKQYQPQLILMDINMPILDGYEATAEIRKISDSVPIIAVTAYAFSSDEERIIKNGFNEYIAKPIKPAMLKAKIIEIMKSYFFLY